MLTRPEVSLFFFRELLKTYRQNPLKFFFGFCLDMIVLFLVVSTCYLFFIKGISPKEYFSIFLSEEAVESLFSFLSPKFNGHDQLSTVLEKILKPILEKYR
jgi:hypothetical protein